MIENMNLKNEINDDEYKKMKTQMEAQLALLQRKAKEYHIPIIIIFEGFGTSGKGYLINKLIHSFDPRGFQVYATEKETKEEKRYPFLWRFATKAPAKGRIAIFDTSWYRYVLYERDEKHRNKERIQQSFQEIKNFERQFIDDGTVMIKLFLHISKKEQKKRMKQLLSSKETAWRVSKEDKKCQEQFEQYMTMANEMIEHTNSEKAPWTVIEAEDQRFATIKVLSTVIGAMQEACNMAVQKKKQNEQETIVRPYDTTICSSVFQQLDLTRSLKKEEYKKRLKAVQQRLGCLHNMIYKEKIPVILAFEGWDAAGKGGVIKRLTEPLDPRGYQVVPIAAPNDIENQHHYLWRFWNTVPKTGHITIYDRTWYGRVLVERIEGFCSEAEWNRAYREINEMEEHLVHEGNVILKFWLHIDKEEQEKRFLARMNDPEKQWKITDEDWRNREKWDQYEQAVNEMVVQTSTTYAPWHMIEGNNKYFERVKVLELVAERLEKEIKRWKREKQVK